MTNESEFDGVPDEILYVAGHIGRNILSRFPDFFRNFVQGVMTIKVLPDHDSDRIQAESVAGIWIKEDRPVIKFFPKNNQWICDDVFFSIFIHDMCTLSAETLRRWYIRHFTIRYFQEMQGQFHPGLPCNIKSNNLVDIVAI